MKSLNAVFGFTLVMGLFSFRTDAADDLQFVQVYRNLSFTVPIFMSSVPDGSGDLVVVEKSGLIKRFPKNNPAAFRTYLDIRDRVQDSGEQGLLGFAFDPNFGTNKFLYAYYIDKTRQQTNVVRYKEENAAVNAATEKSLLTVSQPYANHNGGMIAFGSDQFLYIALGDGGSGGDPHGHGQNLNSHLGKILRIDPNGGDPYAVPKDNPFVGRADAKPEIFAYGLRNPWRFSFDRLTGALWAGDVGQGQWEEVDIVTKGDNFGWNIFEGNARYGNRPVPPNVNFKGPVHAYSRDQGNCITGGYVYRGPTVKSQFGRYIFGDYGSGRIWSINLSGGDLQTLGRIPSIGSFAEDSDGEIYVLSLRGQIFRMSLPEALQQRQKKSEWSPPSKLSSAGFFADIQTQQMKPEFESITPKRSFWSDGLQKKRWMKIPARKKIVFSETEPWEFPVGTILVKHFDTRVSATQMKAIETRVLWKESDDWRSATYKWNEDGSDADLLLSSMRIEIPNFDVETGKAGKQNWYYPAEGECFFCHNFPAGTTLGLDAHQFDEEKLVSWYQRGVLDRAPDSAQLKTYPASSDTNASDEQQARAYLGANCSYCHRPFGIAPGNIDFRFSAQTSAMEIVNIDPELGDLDIPGAKKLKPGNKHESILWQRMSRRGAFQMPPLGSDLVDQKGKDLIGRWIDAQ